MRQVTIKVEDNNFKAFMNFIHTLDYVKVLETKMNQAEINSHEKKSLAGVLSKESVELLVKHGEEIRNEWERDF